MHAWCDVGMYGLRVRSAVELPGWPEAPAGEPQVVIREDAPAPATFDGATYNARTSFADGVVHIEVRGVARYSAEGGTSIRVAPEPQARPEDVRLYLTGAMFGIILHQRGVLPLHASCVAIDGLAAAFAAPSGSGKSTLLAALLRRGAAFVSDDICAMTPVDAGRACVWPGAARMKLDATGMAALDHEAEALEPAGGNRGKFHVPVSAPSVAGSPVPLSRVYLLEFGDGEPRLEPLDGLASVAALVDETYLLSYAAAMGLSTQIFKRAAELSRTLTVSRLVRPSGFEYLDAVVELIERDVRDARITTRLQRQEEE
ncbi:MAG TPA: hypothetical protein VK922_19050 [Gemmatimonadaceae bacterium]|nr:hypothetical protein [Gemmatimonadaceae bacterium]